MPSKVCTTCQVEKSLDMFSPRKAGKYGRQAKCKECLNKQTFEQRKKKHQEYRGKPKNLTQELACYLFDYIDGELFWKNTTHGKIKVGSKVGFINNDGYYTASVYGKKYLNHQIVYLMHHGYFPKEIDHINRDRLDNKIENLREVTRAQNMQNKAMYKRNTSGAKGVSWKKSINKWQVAINVNGVRKYIGVFEDFELAELVSMEARDKFHGIYANKGAV